MICFRRTWRLDLSHLTGCSIVTFSLMIRKNPYKSMDCKISILSVLTKGNVVAEHAHIIAVRRIPARVANRMKKESRSVLNINNNATILKLS